MMNEYAKLSAEELDNLFSSFLINTWSHSAVSTFTRNQKVFEKEYVYHERSKQSATTVAGKAYHKALELFFSNLKEGRQTTIVDMNLAAYNLIDRVDIAEWKLQKTTPSVEECIIAANKTVTALIANFEREKSVYFEQEVGEETWTLDEVLSVEEKCAEWLVVYGVDIPLPCVSVQDVVARYKSTSGETKNVIIDHKSRAVLSDEKEAAFTSAQQAIIYALSVEAKLDIAINEVWFVENKHSQNKDKSPQIRQFTIVLDKDTRMLYEVLLYEPLRTMLAAVSDPDYVYIMNWGDNLTDKAELMEFWARTLVSEVTDFNIPESKRPLMERRQKKIRDASIASINPKTIANFRKNAAQFITYDLTNSDMTNPQKIEHILRLLGKPVEVKHVIQGYSSDTYMLDVSAGIPVASLYKHNKDIAKALGVSGVRMGDKLAVYEGGTYVAVETSKVRTENLLFDPKYLTGRKLPIGMDNYKQLVIWDLDNPSTPHMLICGATGSGKSVSILSTLAYAKLAGVTDIRIFDPKYEFCRHAGDGVTVYNEIEEIEAQMKSLVEDMQARAKSGNPEGKRTMIIFDEFADAVNAARSGKALDVYEEKIIGTYADKVVNGELIQGNPKVVSRNVGREKSLEENLMIILQKGRSLGFNVIVATQRADTKIITGNAKVNLPVQICFRVPKEIDSQVVIDEAGAEMLSGKGDGLMRSPEYLGLVRFQGFFKP